MNISVYQKCANCGACYNICPVGAISVLEEKIFYTLTVDESKCIDCQKCLEVCPVNKPVKTQHLIAAYGGANRNRSIVRQSSSGGVFSAIAESVLSEGGVVYGACFSGDCLTVSIKSTDEVDLSQLRKSKYVESLVQKSFQNVQEQLNQGRKVLFCGAPCQIAGLKRYLKKEYDSLVTCDFSCGGLPSHEIYQHYIKQMEDKFRSKVISVDFRPKTIGWNVHYILSVFASGRKYQSAAILDPYFFGFIGNHFTVRDYCYDCDFANNHASDLILADFWLHKQFCDFREHDNSGLSLIISNSKKGEDLLCKIRDSLDLKKIDNLDRASYNIRKPEYSLEFMQRRKAFIEKYKECGLEHAIRNEGFPTGVHKMKIVVKNYIKRVLIRVL